MVAGVAPAPQRGRESILVVEDEAPLRALVSRLLAQHGYQVCDAGSGAEALARWRGRGGRIELLITDMLLPDGMSGAQLAGRMCAEQPALKVLYMSGYLGSTVSPDLELVEGTNFLPKPFTPDVLLAAVRRRLDGG